MESTLFPFLEESPWPVLATTSTRVSSRCRANTQKLRFASPAVSHLLYLFPSLYMSSILSFSLVFPQLLSVSIFFLCLSTFLCFPLSLSFIFCLPLLFCEFLSFFFYFSSAPSLFPSFSMTFYFFHFPSPILSHLSVPV